MENLVNKLAIVTGASRGIGYAIAKRLCLAKAHVIITGRNVDTLNRASEELGPNCDRYQCDHKDHSSIKSFASTVLEKHGTPDILINNAGCMKSSPVVSLSIDLWQEVIDTNLTGVFLTTQAFLPKMIENNQGDIIMISSMSGKKGDPGSSAYAASKFGLQGFAQSLMHEVRRNNIRVTVINPSRVNTSLADDSQKLGPGLTMHANDLAEIVLLAVTLPNRTLIRDMDVFGTNPF